MPHNRVSAALGGRPYVPTMADARADARYLAARPDRASAFLSEIAALALSVFYVFGV